MPRTYEVPRPRVLLEDAPDELAEKLSVLAGTVERVASSTQVHASDWDLLITFAQTVRQPGPFHVLAFGADVFSGRLVQEARHPFELTRQAPTHARGAYVSEGARPEVRTLAERSIVAQSLKSPAGGRRMWRGSTYLEQYGLSGALSAQQLLAAVRPLVQVGDEGLLHAFTAQRIFGESACEAWVLPAETSDPVAWASAFVEFLQNVDSERFPRRSAWRTSPSWSTRALEVASARIAVLRADRAATIAALDAEEVIAQAELESEAARAAHGEQRLLTDDGDSLVSAVAGALRQLGFGVQEMDDHHDSRTGAKLEDLRVSDPQEPGWIALAEVKGYSRGAKVSDIGQIIGRPATAYAVETGRAADALWHIVNAWRGKDPDARETAIPNTQVDLQPLRDAGGVLVDTRDLFLAIKGVTTDEERARVRAAMRSALGRWNTQLENSPRALDPRDPLEAGHGGKP